jgi:hypothetical protein
MLVFRFQYTVLLRSIGTEMSIYDDLGVDIGGYDFGERKAEESTQAVGEERACKRTRVQRRYSGCCKVGGFENNVRNDPCSLQEEADKSCHAQCTYFGKEQEESNNISRASFSFWRRRRTDHSGYCHVF